MKKLITVSALGIAMVVALSNCSSKRDPGRIYMPDMAYSRAYEAYAKRDTAKFTMDESKRGGHWIFYNDKPVAGTVKRGEMYASAAVSDTTGLYVKSAEVKNPIDSLSAADMAEAGRLYNINCGICHGEKGTGNGPIAQKLGGIANLTLDTYVAMADGTMFHSITYGKNNMGSYASQLDRKQRWMVVKYIRTLQPKKAATPAAAATTTTAAPATTDSTAKKPA